MILGIDPGAITGLAALEKGKLFHCRQYRKRDVFHKLHELIDAYEIKVAAVEQPRFSVLYDRPWFHKAKGASLSVGRTPGGRISASQYQAMVSAPGKSCGNITAGQIKLAQNVGQNIEFTFSIRNELEKAGVRVLLVHPTKWSTKWELNLWMRVFDCGSFQRMPGEHARDAAIIAYLNEGKI